MRRFFNFQLICVLAVMLLGGATVTTAQADVKKKAWSDADGVFYLLTKDGLETYEVEGTITFKAVADGKTVPGYRDCGVVFAPKNEGDQIQITVNSIDLSGANYLLLYDGPISRIGSGTSSGVNQSTYLPDGWVKKYVTGSNGETYTSTSSDGKVSFGFHTGSAGGNTGFTITVTALPSKDMELKSVSLASNETGVNRGAKNQVLASVDVLTEGGANAFNVDNLKVATTALAGSTQVSNVRLYKGNTFTADNALATAQTLGDELVASNVLLKTGHNVFSVVADILPDASGTIPGLTVNEVKVNGNVQTLEASTSAPVAVNNTILMPAEATTFTISDDANFYDDGGKDGKIGEKFTGTVTFVPATEGQKIKVDFSKLAIFNTSSVGYNDVFKFYNGRTADEANLITTLLKDAKVVKSTADDGSMTVTLTSTTGVPAEGWEAVVSQFLPGDMTFKSVTATAASDETVAAGDKQAQMLIVDVLTDNQSNPLALTGFNLASADAKNIEKVSVYSLGETAQFSTSNLFGETAVENGAIAIDGNATLAEGHNYFAVVADVKATAKNGENIALSLTNATVAGVSQSAAEVVAQRTIDNVCRATQGSHSHTIYDTWKFYDKKSTITPSKYEYEQANYIVTFTPAEEGTVAQLDFSKFDVYYASTSYGTKAVFEVYSGTTTTAENLLWKLSDASESSKGPGKSLRSAAADGSITIKFNPNTTSSYYAGTGWEATVTPFKNHAMTIDGVKVNQTSTAIVPVGSANAEIIDFNVNTSGTLTKAVVSEVNVDLKGCENAVSKVSVFYNTTNDAATAVAFGAVENPSSTATISGERELAEGSNHFWVKYDVKNEAASGTELDAKLVSIKTADGNTVEVTDGDPAGVRIAKNIVYMAPDTTRITVVNPTMFYDDGGKDGPVTVGFKGVTIFKPGKENCAVQIETSAFSTGAGKVYIYDGEGVDESKLVGSYNYTSAPPTYISKAADGALTVKFDGPTSTYTSYDGFEMQVSLHELTPFVVDKVEATALRTDAVLRGASNAPMQKIAVTVTGDRGTLKLNNFAFKAEGTTSAADVTAARLFYTGKTEAFSENNCVATLNSVSAADVNTFVAENDVEITDFGTYYFWAAYDIAAEAQAGNNVAAQVTGISVDGNSVAATGATAVRAIKAGMKGNYVIGASAAANYPTFAAATTALKTNGVEGAVVMQIENGTYAENVRVDQIDGVSETNTITFEGQSGNRADVVITGSGYSDPGYGGHKEGVFFIDSTSYVTVKNLSVVPAQQAYPSAIHVYNQSRHVTVDNVAVKAETVLTGYSGMYLIHTEAKDEDGKNNDYFTVSNSDFYGGYIALHLGGTSYVRLTREKGAIAINNTIAEAGSKGIYVTDEDDMLIDGNTIFESTAQRTSYWGIDLMRCRGNMKVSNNKITNTHTYYSGGIYLRTSCYGASADAPILLYNNSISITASPSSSTSGIQITADCNDIHAYHNTVRIGGTSGYCYYTARVTSGETFTNIVMKNNLLQNATTSGATMFVYGSEYIKRMKFSHNAMLGADGLVMASTDIDAFNTLVNDQTNFVEAAEFVSETDLQLLSAGNLCTAEPIEGITSDIKGTPRDSEHPTIGAYEYKDIEIVTPEIAEGYPVIDNIGETSASVKTMWNVSGMLYAKVEKVADESAPAPSRKAARLPKKVVTEDELLNTTPVAVNAEEEATTAFSDLEPGSKYQAYFLVESALDGAKSEIVTTEVFTTLRHFDPLTITLNNPIARINEGESTTLTATVEGGEEPYTYEWRNQMNEVVSTAATASVSPAYTYGYRLTVTSNDGQTATAKTSVYVNGDAVTATFDDNYLAENSHFAGDNSDDKFFSGSYAFNTANMGSWWYGYSISNSTSTAFNSLNDQFNSAVGAGVDGSSNYCVAYPSGLNVDVTNKEEGDSIAGVFISNNAYAISSMSTGDSFAKKFAQGDWFKLSAVGNTANGTKTVDFYLADFTSTNEADHYMLDSWQWMDLRALGKVTSVMFMLTSSDNGQWGMNTPAYFCMDNLNGVRPETEAERIVRVGDSNIDLNELFNLESNGATVTFAVEDVSTTGNITVALNDNALNVNAAANAEKVVVVSATQKGKTQYVRLYISVDNTTGVNDVINSDVKVSVSDGTIKVNGAKHVNIFSTTGAMISTNNEADVVPGVYMIVADGKTYKVLVK